MFSRQNEEESRNTRVMASVKKVLLFTLAFMMKSNHAINDGLHPTPPMGFSSWNAFNSDINERKIVDTVKAIKRLELDKLGYIYITVDDFWNLPERDANGNMQVNSKRFPGGMKKLGKYIHENGLKFGLYSDAGWKTCGGMAGSLGHEKQDVRQFIEYEIDYLKYDNCYPTKEKKTNIDLPASIAHLPSYYQNPHEKVRFSKMAEELLAVKHIRNITFELCLYGYGNIEKWGPSMGHLWRTSPDIGDNWRSLLVNLDRNDEDRFHGRQGPQFGAWNYPDALFVGKGGMTHIEYKTMFALWAAVKAPLMLGSDLSGVNKFDSVYEIIANRELLAVNQDPLGVQATCRKNCCGKGPTGAIFPQVTCPHFDKSWQIWQGPLAKGAFIVIVLNRFDYETEINLNWAEDADLPPGMRFVLRDLWQGKDLGVIFSGDNWKGTLQEHDHRAFKLTPTDNNHNSIQ